VGYQDQLASGREAFAHLIRAWHERNGWSHRVLPGLAEVFDLGRLHNSQLSNLRNRKLASPGPEVFLALGGVNQLLAARAAGGVLDPELADPLAHHPDLLIPLQSSALALVDDQGQVLGPSHLFEIFVGLRQPPAAFDLRIAEVEAGPLSAALAQLLTAGRPWRSCREQVLAAYPVERRQRRERFAEVMAGQSDYSAAELDGELLDLHRTLTALGAADEQELSADLFLELLRRKARLLQPTGPADLAAAIRQELEVAP
jgi:hypothetical protein